MASKQLGKVNRYENELLSDNDDSANESSSNLNSTFTRDSDDWRSQLGRSRNDVARTRADDSDGEDVTGLDLADIKRSRGLSRFSAAPDHGNDRIKSSGGQQSTGKLSDELLPFGLSSAQRERSEQWQQTAVRPQWPGDSAQTQTTVTFCPIRNGTVTMTPPRTDCAMTMEVTERRVAAVSWRRTAAIPAVELRIARRIPGKLVAPVVVNGRSQYRRWSPVPRRSCNRCRGASSSIQATTGVWRGRR